jgi:hypothetical protein
MVGPEMVVVWPNDNGNATLSRRKATRHFMPLIDPAPTRIAALAVRDTHVRPPHFPHHPRKLIYLLPDILRREAYHLVHGLRSYTPLSWNRCVLILS